MNPNKTSDRGIDMLTGFEGLVLSVYLDQASVPTACYGHVVKPEDKAWIADGVTREECRAVLGRDLKQFEDGINRLVKVRITQPMFDALLSFTFNCGLGALERSSVLAYLNQERYNDAADAFTLWRWVRVKQKDGSYARKPILLGRREAEARLFRSGILEVLGARPESGPTWEELVKASQFSLLNLVPYRPAIESEEPTEDELTEDGRLVALPPRPEDCEPQAG